MDWYSWLSKTKLDQSLVYEYGSALVRNEVEEEDLAYFNHDFLQSLGVSVAKHRLEILKLSRKEARGGNGLSKQLLIVMHKTRKLFSKLAFNRPPPELSPYRNAAMRKIYHPSKPALGNITWSGPLDNNKFLSACKNQSVSGPLMPAVYPHRSPMPNNGRSPTMSGPIDRLGLSPQLSYYTSAKVGDDHDHAAQSLWSIMFQDLKPT